MGHRREYYCCGGGDHVVVRGSGCLCAAKRLILGTLFAVRRLRCEPE